MGQKTVEIPLRFPICGGEDEFGDSTEISKITFKRDYLCAKDFRRLVTEIGDLDTITKSKKLRTLAKLLLLETMADLTTDQVDEIHAVDLAVLFVAIDPFFPSQSKRRGGTSASLSPSADSISPPT